ncbi:DHA2 family efflux MFS transporter permease subunit [Novosphingobium sp. TH158]|uniref:DHA2 family efflux MFS transporter permease subunit n=1 Tax=Novosphingobium sp. TH158 TaxID=2067455 RepID=UPI001303F67B|nr:DHA2 family efflux MFS transporter permease subunit [Novosphingobium sp. TH158]
MVQHSYPDPKTALLITIAALSSVILVTLDSTIATIALTRIQSNLAASPEQITWVLTSYLIAAAVMTPLAGWLADRFGRIRTMRASVFFFTLSSLGCGLAPNLELLTLFRFIQGAAGASLVPLSQVLLIDIWPPEKHGTAISAFGIGTLLGPMMGPTLGAWLIEYISWRWIFLINVPIGILALLGFTIFAADHDKPRDVRFDMRGFIYVSIALTAFQLMLDRGQLLDWFSSTEVAIEGAIALLFGYFAVVHILTTKDPFIKPDIFRDWNFALGTAIMAGIGIFMVGAIPIITTMMQQLFGYPVMLTGLVSLPRAIGNIITVMIAGQLVGKVDARILMITGLSGVVAGFWVLSGVSLETDSTTLALVSFVQGLGSGLIFLPLMLLVFTTLPEKYKNEGATLTALMRNLGGAVGISMIQTMTLRDLAASQARLSENVRPENPVVGWRHGEVDFTAPLDVAAQMGQVGRQAMMLAYHHTYQLMFVLSLSMIVICLMMKQKRADTGPAHTGPILID